MFHLCVYFIARTFNQVCHILGFACDKTLNEAYCFVDGLMILALYQVIFLMNYCVIESTKQQILVREKKHQRGYREFNLKETPCVNNIPLHSCFAA